VSPKALFGSVCFYCALLGVVGHALLASGKFAPSSWPGIITQLVLLTALFTASWSRGMRFAIQPEEALTAAAQVVPSDVARRVGDSLRPPPAPPAPPKVTG
jgi:hypothetical protein